MFVAKATTKATNMADNNFTGFSYPESNFSRLPNQIIDLLPKIQSLAELKVVLYILRHTWGFQEVGESKRITLDEFVFGRHRKDDTRMDYGVGMTRESVIDGLRRAEQDGLIDVYVDDRDKARVKKFYGIRMSENPTPAVGKSDPGSRKIRPRTGKDTLERNSRNTLSAPDGAGSVPASLVANKETANGKPKKEPKPKAPPLPPQYGDLLVAVRDWLGIGAGYAGTLAKSLLSDYPDVSPAEFQCYTRDWDEEKGTKGLSKPTGKTSLPTSFGTWRKDNPVSAPVPVAPPRELTDWEKAEQEAIVTLMNVRAR